MPTLTSTPTPDVLEAVAADVVALRGVLVGPVEAACPAAEPPDRPRRVLARWRHLDALLLVLGGLVVE